MKNRSMIRLLSGTLAALCAASVPVRGFAREVSSEATAPSITKLYDMPVAGASFQLFSMLSFAIKAAEKAPASIPNKENTEKEADKETDKEVYTFVTLNDWDYVYMAARGDDKAGICLPGTYHVVSQDEDRYLITLWDGNMGYIEKKQPTFGGEDPSIASSFDDETKMRLSFLRYAFSLENKCPYVWGGKPYRKSDGTITYTQGMDCSGFIEYCIMNVKRDYNLDLNVEDYASTYKIASTHKAVTTLTPGDLVLKTGHGSGYFDCMGNTFLTAEGAKQSSERYKAAGMEPIMPDCSINSDHVGIYVGEKDGVPLYVHLNGTTNTVSINSPDYLVVKRDLFDKK